MTYQDVMLQVLSEVTGAPKSRFRATIEMSKPLCLNHRFDEEVPPAEAEKLLKELRQEKAGILSWLLEGNRQAQRIVRNARKLD